MFSGVAGGVAVAVVHARVVGLVDDLRKLRDEALLRERGESDQDRHICEHEVVGSEQARDELMRVWVYGTVADLFHTPEFLVALFGPFLLVSDN